MRVEYHLCCRKHCIRAISEVSCASVAVFAFNSNGVPSIRLYTTDDPNLLLLRLKARALLYVQFEMGLEFSADGF